MLPITYYIILSLILFSIGMLGVMIRRNSIILLMCIELMLNSVNLLLVAFSKMHEIKYPDIPSDGQLFVFFIMVVAAAEVTVGLAIMVLLYRKIHSVDINALNKLKQ